MAKNKLPNGLEAADGMIYMYRCPKCGRENYVFNVTLGICTWCGYNAHDDWNVEGNKAVTRQ